jgi:hypothetical protein
MKPRTRNLLVTATVAATAITLLPGSAAVADDVSLHFDGTITKYTAIPERPSTELQHPGDQTLFDTTLASRGRVVGNAPHHCVAVDASNTLCTAVADLPGGQISLQTLLTASTTNRLAVSVTGGNGKYRAASGQLNIVLRADGSQAWTFDLTLP